jgi:hypothetical protein
VFHVFLVLRPADGFLRLTAQRMYLAHFISETSKDGTGVLILTTCDSEV